MNSNNSNNNNSNTEPSEPFDPYGLTGRIVIVTGGGQALGREFVKHYAAAGAIPVIADINLQKAQSVVQEVESTGAQALAVHVDVGDEASVNAMAKTVLEKYGRIDILVNNAAIFSTLKMRPFEEIPLDEWDDVMRVNVKGVFMCCRAVVPAMRKAGWGRIVNMSSGVIMAGAPNYLHYPTSKAAVVGLTRALARELGNTGITVNAVLPGAIATEIERETVSPEAKIRITKMQSIQRPGDPEDLVGSVMFLSSEASNFYTGQSMSVDGGIFFR